MDALTVLVVKMSEAVSGNIVMVSVLRCVVLYSETYVAYILYIYCNTLQVVFSFTNMNNSESCS